ncbi:MAG: hypothetical protein P8M32_01510 [Phycisphaerales bacterium]|nr:hypothetical protein [Phycisphaerales bacterium]
MRASVAALTIVGVGFFGAQAASGQDHPAATPAQAQPQAEPTAEAIVERHIELTGGREAWESLQSIRGLGSIVIRGANVGGQLAMFQTRDGFRMSVDAGGPGAQVTIRRGQDAWSVRPDGTVQKISGGALQKLLRDRKFNPLVDAASMFTSMAMAGVEDVNGSPAWKITCISSDESGAVSHRFFDVASGLQVKVIEQEAGAAAAFPTEMYMSDYRDIGGVKVAFATAIGVGRSGVTITIEAMQANVDIPSCLFEPPSGPVIVEKKKQESPAETLGAFMKVDIAALSKGEAIHWLGRLDAAKRSVDPAAPDAESLTNAISECHRLCAEKIRGAAPPR